MTSRRTAAIALFVAFCSSTVLAGGASETTFTYQGQLKLSGVPVNNVVDLSCKLFDDDVGGSQVGTTEIVSEVFVQKGLFSVELDFGAEVFQDEDLWLEVAARIPHDPGDTEPFVPLEPRQPINATPFALQTRGFFVDAENNIGFGTTSPERFFHAKGNDPDVLLDINSASEPTRSQILFAQDGVSEAQIRWHKSEDRLALHNGGRALVVDSNARVGVGTSSPETPLNVVGGSDVSLSGGGSIQIGSFDGNNLAMDANEIMARDGNGTTNPLFLQDEGGDVLVNHERVQIGPDLNNAGRVEVRGTNGNWNVAMGSLRGQTGVGTTSANHGQLRLYDQNGTPQITLDVQEDDGSGDIDVSGTITAFWVSAENIFGDLKNFRVPNPNQPGTDIVYACIEGPEAAAYTRGTATLMDGKATITLPEHFRTVAAEEGMTVQLTPRSAKSPGLAATRVSLDGIRVEELKGGTGNYEFDFLVTAVRARHEDYQVIRPTGEELE